MTKRIVFAGLLVSIIATPVAAQTKAEEPKEVIWEDDDIDIMDKRSPEERDQCAKGFVQSGGEPKVFKDDPDTNTQKGGAGDINIKRDDSLDNIKCDDPRRVIWEDTGID